MNAFWRPLHEVYPEQPREPDVLAFVEGHEQSIGRAHLMTHSGQAGRWRWSMYARSSSKF